MRLLVIIFVLISVAAAGQGKRSTATADTFVFRTILSLESVVLRDDHTCYLVTRSCTDDDVMLGKWYESGDTVVVNYSEYQKETIEEGNIRSGKRDKSIYIIVEDSLNNRIHGYPLEFALKNVPSAVRYSDADGTIKVPKGEYDKYYTLFDFHRSPNSHHSTSDWRLLPDKNNLIVIRINGFTDRDYKQWRFLRTSEGLLDFEFIRKYIKVYPSEE